MLLLCVLVVGLGNVWATDPSVTFTFNTDAGIAALGITKPSSSAGTSLATTAYTLSGVSMTVTHGSTDTRVWNSSGTLDLRIYKSGGSLKFDAPGTITGITITGSTVNVFTVNAGTYSAGTWTKDDKNPVTSVTFTATGTGKINTITVSYAAPAPSITAADVDIAADVLAGNISYSISNPDGSTLTAARKSGDWLTVGAVDAVNKKVAFTATENTGDERTAVVTLTYGDVTKDVTITQAAAATKYEVTYSAPSNGTLVVKRGETTVSSGDKVSDGTVLTIEATPSDAHDYALSKWEYKEDGGSWTDGVGTSYSVDGKDVEFRATFVARIYHDITYSVNGATTIVEVEEGDDVSFAAPASGVPMGYTFKGWRTSTLALTDTDPNDYVTSGTSSADITYYAVFAVDTKTPTTTHLTGDEIASEFAATAMKYADDEATYSDTSEGMTWGARCITNATRHWIQLKSDNDVYIKAVAPQNITQVKVKISNTSNSSGGIDDISKHGAFSGTVNLDKVQDTNSGACGSAASSAIVDNYLTISANGTSKTIYIHVTAAARVWSVDVTYNTTSTSHYCTTISDLPVTVSSASYATFVSDLPLDFTGASINAYIAEANGTTGVTFTSVNKVPANTGVLLYKDKGATEYVPVLDGAADDVDGNVFKAGTGAAVASVSGSNHNYILNNVGGVVGFYRANGQTVAANRAYIQITEAAAKGFIELPAFDDATAIESVQGSEFRVQDSAIYNLAGQRMSRLQKGVNIVNGKKVLVK